MKLLKNARIVSASALQRGKFEREDVLICGGKIIARGPNAQAAASAASECARLQVIECSHLAICAGFYNAHSHLDFAAARLNLGDFARWHSSIFSAQQASAAHQSMAIAAAISELLASGVTHLGDISSSGASLVQLASSGIKALVYAELLCARDELISERLRGVCEKIALIKALSMRPALSIHAPYSVSLAAAQKAVALAAREDLLLSVHWAESRYESEMLANDERNFAANLADFEANLHDFAANCAQPPGGERAVTGKKSSAENCAENCAENYAENPAQNPAENPLAASLARFRPENLALSSLLYELPAARTQLVHGCYAAPSVLARFGEVAHCARSNALLGSRVLEYFGDNLALGTDGMSSNFSMNFLDELRAALWLHTASGADAAAVAARLLASAQKRPFASAPEICEGEAADLVALVDLGASDEQLALRLLGDNARAVWTMIDGQMRFVAEN